MKSKRDSLIPPCDATSALSPKLTPLLHPHLKGYLGYCFFRAALRIRCLVNTELEKFGVIAPQYGILIVLDKSGPLTQVELGAQMAIDKATMVRMIDALEEKKYLTRVTSPTDRRAKLIQITVSGKQAIVKMDKARKTAETRALRRLNAAEQEQLRKIITKLVSSPQDGSAG